MSKYTIKWHEENLKRMRITLNAKRQELSRLEEYYRRLESDVRFLDDQIQSAKVTKKESFDSDKYKRKTRVGRKW